MLDLSQKLICRHTTVINLDQRAFAIGFNCAVNAAALGAAKYAHLMLLKIRQYGV